MTTRPLVHWQRAGGRTERVLAVCISGRFQCDGGSFDTTKTATTTITTTTTTTVFDNNDNDIIL